MQSVLVVGGGGYIGSELCAELERRNYHVTAIDNGMCGKRWSMRLPYAVRCYTCDMRDVTVEYLSQFDTVINLAGLSNDPQANRFPKLNHELNCTAALKLAANAKAAGVVKFIQASSASVYDSAEGNCAGDHPRRETDVVNPTSNYAKAKRACEVNLQKLASQDFQIICLRKGTVFGPSQRMRFDLVANQMTKNALIDNKINIHNGGEIYRPMLYIEDAVNAYCAAICLPPHIDPFQIINVVTENVTIGRLAQWVQTACTKVCGDGISISSTPVSSVRNYIMDCTKMTAFGFWCTALMPDKLMELARYVARMQQAGLDMEAEQFYNLKMAEKFYPNAE